MVLTSPSPLIRAEGQDPTYENSIQNQLLALKWVWFSDDRFMFLVMKQTVIFNFAIMSLDIFNFWFKVLLNEQFSSNL